MHDQLELQASQYIISILENSKSQSEEALDTLPGIYAVVDGDGKILKGNRRLAELFGMNHENLLGVNICGLFSDPDKKPFLNKISELTEFELEVAEKNDTFRNYLWYSSRLKIDRQNMPFYSIIGRDVTALTIATKENSRMQFELSTAKIVQNTFFPPTSATFGNSSIAGYSETASECGGDWWHYNLKNDKLYLWIGDVTGHGVTAALVVSAVHSIVSILAEMTPSASLAILNRAIAASAGTNHRVMTFLVACIDLNTKKCTYASAGHEPIILLPHDKVNFKMDELKLLTTNPSTPLGSAKTGSYEETSLQLNAGDRLIFHTDGLYDIVSQTGTSWNKSVFYRTVALHASQTKSSKELVSGIKKSIDDFRTGALLKDDATLFSFQL